MLQLQQNQPLSSHSTLGIGGLARYFVSIASISELQEALAFSHEKGLSFHILGKGSNSLFSDKGFDGLVILNKIAHSEIKGTAVTAGAGKSFAYLGVQTAKNGLAGLEFASGIPASVGGAVFMNAGANGQEVGDVVTSVTFVTAEGEVRILPRDVLAFSYRKSSFHEMKGAIAEVAFELVEDPGAKWRQKEIVDYRLDTQPYKDKSCGCIFRNPKGMKAGALIDECGLKGFAKGGASVSTMHANFIINKAGAKAEEVLSLARDIQQRIKEQKGVDLELELRVIPESYEHLPS